MFACFEARLHFKITNIQRHVPILICWHAKQALVLEMHCETRQLKSILGILCRSV